MAAPARFLSGEKTWKRIREGVKAGPAQVAVAWWGSEMSKLLPLKRGSVLVVRADQATMEQGQTNPFELEKLVKRGVRVFPLKNLHAKVFVFRDWAVVGSMNVSSNSWTGRQLEAAVEFRGTLAVGSARTQVLEWACDKPLDLDDLKELKKQYTPARGGGGAKPKPAPARMDLPVLHLLRTSRTGGWKEHTHQRFNTDAPPLKKEAARRGEQIEGIEWTGTGIPPLEPNLRVLEIATDDDDSVWLCAPARLRRVTATARGKPEKLIYLSRAVGVRRRRLSEVAKTLGKNTRLVKQLRSGGKRVFKDADELTRLFGLWSSQR